MTDISNNISNDISNNISNDISNNISNDISNNISNDISNNVSNDVRTYTLEDVSGNAIFTTAIVNTVVCKSLNGLQDVIRTVNFILTLMCDIDRNKKDISNYYSVMLKDPDPSVFKPLEEITREEIIGWLNELSEINRFKEAMLERMLTEYNKNEFIFIP